MGVITHQRNRSLHSLLATCAASSHLRGMSCATPKQQGRHSPFTSPSPCQPGVRMEHSPTKASTLPTREALSLHFPTPLPARCADGEVCHPYVRRARCGSHPRATQSRPHMFRPHIIMPHIIRPHIFWLRDHVAPLTSRPHDLQPQTCKLSCNQFQFRPYPTPSSRGPGCSKQRRHLREATPCNRRTRCGRSQGRWVYLPEHPVHRRTLCAPS